VEVPQFSVRGTLGLACSLPGPLEGSLVVERSKPSPPPFLPEGGSLPISLGQLPIASIELSIQRVETAEPGKEETSEVQDLSSSFSFYVFSYFSLSLPFPQIMSLQVGEGDVAQGLEIPLHLLLPRSENWIMLKVKYFIRNTSNIWQFLCFCLLKVKSFIHLLRFFVCPTTTNSMFSVAFQLTISVMFANNTTVSESFDIVTKRMTA
jgi:hypothetical protein